MKRWLLALVAIIDAALMAINEINQQGGLLEREIKPVVADGACPDGASSTRRTQSDCFERPKIEILSALG